MPSYNFKKEFSSKVESGEKLTTIRPKRKYPTRPGQTAHLFYAQRTKYCRRLRSDLPRITSVTDMTITGHGTILDDLLLTDSAELFVAKADGFDSVEAFRDFFRKQYGLPKKDMELIRWNEKKPKSK